MGPALAPVLGPLLAPALAPVLAMAMSVGLGCSSEKGSTASTDTPEQRSHTKRTSKPASPPEPSARDGFRLSRSLLKEVSRAELRIDGTLIDFGTSDQHKYTRGGWDTGWVMHTAKGTTSARLSAEHGRVNTYLDVPAKELVMRARSLAGPQTLSVASGSRALGELALTEEWQELRLTLPELGTGRKKFKFSHDEGSELEVDWLWLSTKQGKPAPTLMAKAGPAKMGKSLRRSLLAPGPRSYSYYLEVPSESALIFDYGSKQPLDFAVYAHGVDGAKTELFRAAGQSKWQSAKVDLGELAGQTVRLEFACTGAKSPSESLGAWGEPGIYLPAPDEPAPTLVGKKAKNLVLVVLDTTRADQFESFAPGNGIHTPKLDRFSERSTAFTRAYNTSNWTKPSVLSIMSSLYPATHTATKPESMVPEDVELLSEHMQKSGLRTQGFSSNPVVSDRFGFQRGWDDYQVFYDNEAQGEAMYRRASKWVEDNGDEPFFLYIQTIDPHTTYSPPRRYSSRYYSKTYKGPIGSRFTREDQSKVNEHSLAVNADDVAWIQALYHGEISYQDEHVGAFLDALDKQGRLDDTIVVVTNDHGEEIYDHGSFGHGWTLYEEMIRAPLIIHYPPLFPIGKINRITEQIDLAPTLLEAMGLPAMAGIEGASFLPSLHGTSESLPDYAIALSDNGKRAIEVGGWKLEVSESSGWRYLFDMRGAEGENRDRREDAELAGRYCEIYMAEGMANPGKLDRLSGMGVGRKISAQDAVMDEATRKQMEALGYL